MYIPDGGAGWSSLEEWGVLGFVFVVVLWFVLIFLSCRHCPNLLPAFLRPPAYESYKQVFHKEKVRGISSQTHTEERSNPSIFLQDVSLSDQQPMVSLTKEPARFTSLNHSTISLQATVVEDFSHPNVDKPFMNKNMSPDHKFSKTLLKNYHSEDNANLSSLPLAEDIVEATASPQIQNSSIHDVTYSSLSSSESDDYESLADERLHGRKRKRGSFKKDKEHWILEDRHYLLPQPPVSNEEYIKKLEKGFTGYLPNNQKPEFLFVIGSE